MIEFDPDCERRWFRVGIDAVAEFIVKSYTEEGALLKTSYHLLEHPELGISLAPDPTLRIPPEFAKPLEPFEEQYYSQVGDDTTPVRLIADFRKLPEPQPRPQVMNRADFIDTEPEPVEGQLFDDAA
jgi:hypothetical protein